MALEECFLPAGCRRPVNSPGPWDIRSENRWQVTSWPRSRTPISPKSTFGFPAGQVRLPRTINWRAATAFDTDLRPSPGHVSLHHRVGHIIHTVPIAQPVENPADGVAFAWCVEVGARDVVNQWFKRIEVSHSGRVGGAAAATLTLLLPPCAIRHRCFALNPRLDTPARASRRDRRVQLNFRRSPETSAPAKLAIAVITRVRQVLTSCWADASRLVGDCGEALPPTGRSRPATGRRWRR